MPTTRIAILGTGAMGTACSLLLAENPDHEISLWGHHAGHVAELQQQRENHRLLPGFRVPDRLQITADAAAATAGADWLVAAIPTMYLRDTLAAIAPVLPQGKPVVSVIKGLENGTLLRPSQIIQQVLPGSEVVALCGPSHAEELCRRLPASVVAAHPDIELARQVQALFTTEYFRVYSHSDLLGVELGGALKNVLAIAAGISDGLGYGDNAKAALLSRGLVEMTRFGLRLGADAKTFTGLAGLGDLVTTCFSPFGRNRAVGMRLGKGEKLADILASMSNVAEGVRTSRSIHDLAQQLQLEMPITEQIYKVLFEDLDPYEATMALMLRPPKDE